MNSIDIFIGNNIEYYAPEVARPTMKQVYMAAIEWEVENLTIAFEIECCHAFDMGYKSIRYTEAKMDLDIAKDFYITIRNMSGGEFARWVASQYSL